MNRRYSGFWETLVRVGSQHSPTALDIGVEVSNVKAPWASAAAVLDVRNQTLLHEIAELPLADRQILGGFLGFHEPRSDGSLFR